ncbi:MAG: OmpA family protein [Prevotella sp.]|nr:OmpA family protein [Prevotella sp.]
MKKFLMLLAFASVSVASMAQDAVPTEKYSVATNSFWSNWFVQANVNYSAFYNGTSNIFANPFYKFPLGTGVNDNDHNVTTALGFSVAIGKWFTPGIGLRTKGNFMWLGKAFDSDVDKYLTVNEQVLFNLSNMICGYNENRIWNFIPYAGAGVGRNFDAKSNTLVYSAGLLNTFRLGKVVSLNLELAYNSYGSEWSGMGGVSPKHRVNQFAVEVGATFNIGKTTGWNKTPDVEAIKALSQGQIDALNAQLADANAENARLQKQIRDHKCPTTTNALDTKSAEKVIVSAPVSVFFNLGKAKIASQKDLQNVQAVADAAKANNAKIVVTGYADSKTGSANLNQSLSQKRAEAVADALVNMGVDRSNIEINAAGGVDTLSPISYNRRATVELK